MKWNCNARYYKGIIFWLMMAGLVNPIGFGAEDPCEDPLPPEHGTDYDDNCWAFTPQSSDALFTPLWEKKVEVDCPSLSWEEGDAPSVVLCGKVGSGKTGTANRPGSIQIHDGEIRCIYEAEGHDCDSPDPYPCVIDPESLSTTWKIESDYDVTPSGSGDEAEFTVQIPEDASGPIEFDVAFTVATEGPYPELLEEHNCNNMEVESGRVPVIVHPVKLIITYEPEEPWAGDVVSYSLGENSLVPPDMEVQWIAPNNLYTDGNCEVLTFEPTYTGGMFMFDPHHSCQEYIIAHVCSVVAEVVVSSKCIDCILLYNQWLETYEWLNMLFTRMLTLEQRHNLLSSRKSALELSVALEILPQFGNVACGPVQGSNLARNSYTVRNPASIERGIAGVILEFCLELTGRVMQPTSSSATDQVLIEIAELASQKENIKERMYYFEECYANALVILRREANMFTDCVGEEKYSALCIDTAEHWSVERPVNSCSVAEAQLPEVYHIQVSPCVKRLDGAIIE